MLSLLDPSYRPETVPAAFFLHFDPSFHRGRAAVDKHLEFFRFTGMDLLKIQFEHAMPSVEIRDPQDWSKVPLMGRDFWEEPLAVVKGLVQAAGKEAVVVLTLYSSFMLACGIGGQDAVVRHIAQDPAAFRKGMDIITEGLLLLVKECAALGLDGFYASTQGGEKGRLPDARSFTECVRPYDMAVMTEIDRLTGFNILHVCDYHLPYQDITPFTSYPGHVVNASLKLTGGDLSAAEVGRMFDRPFMGGLDRKGVLATGPADAIRREVSKVISAAPARFILAADCTVPSETPWENLKTAIQAAHEHTR